MLDDDRTNGSERIGPLDRVVYEFPVEGNFEECGAFDYGTGTHCRGKTRLIEYLPSNDGKRLICGDGHPHEHNGKKFIPAYEFEPGGDFGDVLPDELRPTQKELRSKRWKLSSEKTKRLGKYNDCACCGVPAFGTYKLADTAALLEWIARYDDESR